MKVSVFRGQLFPDSELYSCFPPRKRNSHKGDYGKVLILAGGRGFTGAPVLAAEAALRCGSGLVYLGVPESVYPQVSVMVKEAVVFPLPADGEGRFSSDAIPAIEKRIRDCDAVLFGPGCGRGTGIRQIADFLLLHSKIPIVFDADAISVFQSDPEKLCTKDAPLVITPHDGEFARVYTDQKSNRRTETLLFSRTHRCTVLRKGCNTLISDGNDIYTNTTGNPGMATGGSGDVLAGMLVSLAARGIPLLKAAAAAAKLHGICGDLAAEKTGEYALLPRDMILQLKNILP